MYTASERHIIRQSAHREIISLNQITELMDIIDAQEETINAQKQLISSYSTDISVATQQIQQNEIEKQKESAPIASTHA